MADIPTSDNVLNFNLEANEPEPVVQSYVSSYPPAEVKTVELSDAVLKPTLGPGQYSGAKVSQPVNEKIIAWDTETTGTNPWDYRLVVASFWDLSKPVNSMVTFWGFDEEKLTNEIAAYLNEEKPTLMVCYNNGFDQRALLTRFMQYHVKVPGWNDIEQIDVMEILKKGTTNNLYSSQATGTEENWFEYFFGEKKPYTIEECFAALRDGDLEPMVIRNRTCTASEGQLYLLFRYVTDVEEVPEETMRPTVSRRAEELELGVYDVACEVCDAINEIPNDNEAHQCYRCLAELPKPTTANIIKEVARPYDFSKVGLKETTTKTTTSKAKATTTSK